MLFINTMRIKDFFYTLPAEEQAKILGGVRAFTGKYLKMGKFRSVHVSVDLKSYVVIWEAESAEEAARLFAENPGANYTDYDSFPIIEYSAYLNIMKGAMEAAQKAAMK
jgi:hypothetical protein